MSTRFDPDSRILTRAALIERYRRPRMFRLVFTNGCFDILHRGHAEYLLAASRLGDALVVALNTDASVRRLKGPGRPVVAETDRAFLIATLACVDAVTLFSEDSPHTLISELLPDVLVKGADYRPDEVIGRAEVEAAGGRLTLVPYRKGHSTSELLERIRAR
ncbi:MAG: D-glycero-beta-D-manno-heptose 1-phosphate adenylyltransferase [Longimicrobiales bacterium]